MSLDVYLEVPNFDGESERVYDANITHNLGTMADKAGIYMALWRPEEVGYKYAHQLIEPLVQGLVKLKKDPAKYSAFNSPNGWGMYEHFVPFVEKYLRACQRYPLATVHAWR